MVGVPPQGKPPYAEVAVDAQVGYDRTFTYAIPNGLAVQPGHLVWVPFGPRLAHGIVFGLAHVSPVAETRPIGGLMDDEPLLRPHQLELARWISHHYLAPLYQSASLMLPPGFPAELVCALHLTDKGRGIALGTLPNGPRRLLEHLHQRGPSDEGAAARAVGRGAGAAVRHLLEAGLVERRWRWKQPRAGVLYVSYLRLPLPLEQRASGESAGLPDRRAHRQAELLHHLAQKDSLSLAQARKEFGHAAVKALMQKGLVAVERRQRVRDPLAGRTFPPEAPLILTEAQSQAVATVADALEGTSGGRSFLLQGVTGSGKTEVYLRAIAHCLALGKRAMFLVPEISLTAQFIARLGARFPGRLAVLHSRLSPGERFDTWWRVRRGEFGVVLGSRSALFAPQPDLGLIVMDEEHEWTYKQHEASPLYHAREVALKLAELTGAVVILGSATPDVVTCHKALQGRYSLLTLPGRLGAGPNGRAMELPLAQAQVVDMRQELKEGNRSIFSRALQGALASALRRGEQAILFLNRRGAASFVQCRDCGHVLRCRQCNLSLTYHSEGERLLCHQCSKRYPVPSRCPQCQSPRIRYLGLGTQRVVEEVRHTFGVEALRWDRDAAKERRAHEELMARFAAGETLVLVGTQMIAKGLHLPRVTLVGVLLADLGLHLPDFRAGERTFQVLCQVAGRAGRGDQPGRVIIQTYSPHHYAVEAAASQDYLAFYRQEIAYRQALHDPPFSRLARLLFRHTNNQRAQREALRLGASLRAERDAHGLGEVEIIGPAPLWPPRVRGHYHWHIILRAPDPVAFLERVPVPQGWIVDVDPVTLM